jgi:predicted ATPase with chaperone activity
MARPSDYNEEIADVLCEEIAQGAALYRLCADRDDLPAERTVYQWLEKSTEFAQKYARARDRQQDREADHCIVIADTTEDPAKARVQIDARKWRASKLAPKKYGDRVELEHAGKVTIDKIERVIVDPAK